jgi:hypothetical protein
MRLDLHVDIAREGRLPIPTAGLDSPSTGSAVTALRYMQQRRMQARQGSEKIIEGGCAGRHGLLGVAGLSISNVQCCETVIRQVCCRGASVGTVLGLQDTGSGACRGRAAVGP